MYLLYLLTTSSICRPKVLFKIDLKVSFIFNVIYICSGLYCNGLLNRVIYDKLNLTIVAFGKRHLQSERPNL